MQEYRGQALDRSCDPWEEMATHRNSCLENPQEGAYLLESMGHDWVTKHFPQSCVIPGGCPQGQRPCSHKAPLPCRDPNASTPGWGGSCGPFFPWPSISPFSTHFLWTLPTARVLLPVPSSGKGWALAPAPEAGVGGEFQRSCSHSSPKVSEPDTPYHHKVWFPFKCVHPRTPLQISVNKILVFLFSTSSSSTFIS